MKWRGLIETFESVEADTGEEAKKQAAEALIERLQSGEAEFIVWEDES